MRIITGSARGIALQTLEGEATRPTPAVVKEAIAKEAAEEMVKKFAEAGAKAVLK